MSAPARQPPFALLAAMTALGPLAQNIFIPSMPGLPEVFGADYAAVQFTLSLYFLGFAVAQLVYGPVSDRFGRRPAILAGIALFCAGTAICLVATELWMLMLGRFVQAVGGCAGLVLPRAVIRDVHDRDKAASVIAYVVMAMVVAPMFAPLIGGMLDELYGWRANFALTGVAGAIVLAAAIWKLNETAPKSQDIVGLAGLMRAYRTVLSRPAFRAYTGNAAFLAAGFFAFLGAAPYVVVEAMGRAPSVYGAYFILPAATYMAANFVAGRISRRVGVDRMVMLGSLTTWSGAMLMLAAALAGALHPLAVFLPMALFTFGNGLCFPNAMAGAVGVEPGYAGTASGLLGFIQLMVGAVASAIAGALVADSQLPLALVMAVTATIAVVYAAQLLRGAGSRHGAAARPAE